MAGDPSLAAFMGRLRSGEDDAAGDLFVRLAHRQVGPARNHPAGTGVKMSGSMKNLAAGRAGNEQRAQAASVTLTDGRQLKCPAR